MNPARQTVKAHDVEPYGVLFDRDLWYLAGRCVDTDLLKVYRADRVRNLEISGLFFSGPTRRFRSRACSAAPGSPRRCAAGSRRRRSPRS
ncbi:WYL domain-containing protein [Roseibium salinum]|nr:WYL domain-containing protein [Roseibium salinum]